MSRPCTHCNGSGTEPDPIHEAYVALVGAISSAQVTIALKDELARAVAAYDYACAGRISDLEGVVRAMLSRFTPSVPGSDSTISRLANADLEVWRALLGDPPGD